MGLRSVPGPVSNTCHPGPLNPVPVEIFTFDVVLVLEVSFGFVVVVEVRERVLIIVLVIILVPFFDTIAIHVLFFATTVVPSPTSAAAQARRGALVV